MANAFDAIVPPSTSSTSSSSNKPCYDVFINHHGKDVKRKLASTIYNVLDLMEVPVFLDQDELEVGDPFPPAIEEAMRSASVHIAIFSPNYAKSAWCLEELSFSLSLMQEFNVAIIPVFYGVDPSHLRRAMNGIYAAAFRQHEKNRRYDPKNVEKWKEALSRVSDLKGCTVDVAKCDEGKLVREIVESVLHKIKTVPLKVATFPVGLDKAVQDFETKVVSSTGSQNVHIVGIFGMGGSGKTTLAKELFNRKCFSISRSSFLSNVRDGASKDNLHNLQKNLLKDLCIQHSEFHNIHQGKGFLDKGFQNSKGSMTVLIVLDDVDSVDQLEALLPPKDNLGQGSFIIVTTRELRVLTTWGISSNYAMKLLEPSIAKQLFCKHAFLQPYSKPGFELLDKNYHNFQHLIERFVEACKGLPLALKVFGAMVNGRQKSYWEAQFQKISRILPREIEQRLKLSYEALEPEDQQMFLDIACFFVGIKKSLVIAIWDGLGWNGEVGLEILVNKCLVTLDKKDCIEMHDHLRDVGRRIAKDSEHSRIWKGEQISNQRERTQIRGIVSYGIRDFCSTLEHCMEKIRAFLPALQFLAVRGNEFREEFWALLRDVVWLRVDGFDGTNLPSWLSLGNLTVLELYNTKKLKELWQDNVQLPLKLRVLILDGQDGHHNGMWSFPENLCHLESLEFLELSGFPLPSSLPDSFGNLTNLRTLDLRGAQLTALPDSIGNLTNLRTLDLQRAQLTALPDSIGNLTNLRSLDLQRAQLTALPDSIGNLTNLESLDLQEAQLTALPDSIGNLTNLRSLDLRGAQLTAFPDSIGNLTNLRVLDLRGAQLTAFPDSIGNLTHLRVLDLRGAQLMALSDSIGNLTELRVLDLRGAQLTALPDFIGNLTNLGSLNLQRAQLTAFPDSIGNLTNLRNLDLQRAQLTALPDSIGNLTNLGTLDLQGAQLTALPDSIGNLTKLPSLGLKGAQLTALPDFIGNLTKLPSLDLRRAQLTALPDSIGNLTNLRSLGLRGAQLTALPDSIGNLTNLRSIGLQGAQLTALPDSIGNLTNLVSLGLQEAQLTALPDSIGNLTNLGSLDLQGAQLTALPDSFGNLTNLVSLDLQGAQLTALPDSIGNLTNLRSLDLQGAQLTALPISGVESECRPNSCVNINFERRFGGCLLCTVM